MDPHTAANNLKNEQLWRRLAYIVVFVIAFNVAELVLWAVVAVQFLSRLFSGRPIERASVFGQGLASYAYQIVCFLTFRTDQTPWPFAPWPDRPVVVPATRADIAPADAVDSATAKADTAKTDTADKPKKRTRRRRQGGSETK
ncbi:MAG: DUF4389 domain-containing protein [Proteobacteria bacterium]|nr:DUF4389 domain-containing protein [Pseudomonadota bacterium]